MESRVLGAKPETNLRGCTIQVGVTKNENSSILESPSPAILVLKKNYISDIALEMNVLI